MKKLMTIACMGALAFTMAGCSDATANISDGSEKLITIGGTSLTKQDVYDMLKPNNIGAATLELLKANIYEKEGITTTDEMQKTADEKLASLKTSIGDSYEDALKQAGYTDDNDVMEQLILPSLYQSELQKKYVSDNAEAVYNTYHPVKAQIMQCEDEEKAKKALEAVKNGDDFKTVVKEYGVTTTYDGTESLYTKESGLADDLFSEMSSAGKGYIDKVITDSASGNYYVVNMTNVTPDEYKDEVISTVSQLTAVSTETLKFYFEKYDMTIYDIDAYNSIENNGLIVQ